MSNLGKDEKNTVGDLLGAVVSIAVPLVQLVAVTSVAFQEQLKLSDKLPNGATTLPLTNLFVMVVVLSIIGHLLASNWGKFRLGYKSEGVLKRAIRLLPRKIQELLLGNESFDYNTDVFGKVISKGLKIQFVSFLLFYSLFLTQGDFSYFILTQGLFTLFIYFSYFIFYVCSGVIIFASIKKYFEMRQTNKPEHAFANLVESLRGINLLNETKVVLEDSDSIPNSYGQYVSKVLIENKKYIVTTDYTRKVIYGCWDEKNAPKTLKLMLANRYLPTSPAASASTTT